MNAQSKKKSDAYGFKYMPDLLVFVLVERVQVGPNSSDEKRRFLLLFKMLSEEIFFLVWPAEATDRNNCYLTSEIVQTNILDVDAIDLDRTARFSHA